MVFFARPLRFSMAILFAGAVLSLVTATPKQILPRYYISQKRERDPASFKERPCTTTPPPPPPSMLFRFCRGGSSSSSAESQGHDGSGETKKTGEGSGMENEADPTNINATFIDRPERKDSFRRSSIKVRHTPDVIWKLLERHGINEESYDLRKMITTRAQKYLDDLAMVHLGGGEKVPDPLGVLHDMAPKIPAIRQSPSFILRITSATSEVDAGAAACAIGMIARLCELYDKKISGDSDNMKSTGSVIIKDRRFEQLVECVLCGVDVKMRRREGLQMRSETASGTEDDIETLLDGESGTFDEGLTVADSCRAAWGLSMLGGYNIETFGDENTHDILIALSLLTRELLLGRLKKLRQGEVDPDTTQKLSLTQRFNRDAEALAEDAAAAMWTFACVKACTGLRSVPLFETCCSILCQDPTDLRLRAQEKKSGFDDSNFEVNDVVERLALSETQTVSDAAVEPEMKDPQAGNDSRGTLIDWLSPNEVTDAIWSLALHGSTDDIRLLQPKKLSETSAIFREVAFDRLREWLQKDLDDLQQAHSLEQMFKNPEDDQVVLGWGSSDDSTVIEVVDASVILAMERSSESMVPTIENISVAGSVEEVQVVDAASLLAAADPASIPRVETEIIVTSSTNLHRREHEDLTFSSHNLCAIAWAVTDLNDPLQGNIVDAIVNILMLRGSDRSSGLVGGNLANLAWSIAKRADIENADGNEIDATSCLAITEWITQQALALGIDNKSEFEASKLLKHLQPPEIGRLMWSIASTTTILVDTTINSSPEASHLAALCLRVAASNLAVFGTEDLARIAWAFLTLHRHDENMFDLTVSEPLGQILSIVETSLLRWESGQQPVSASAQLEDYVRFSSFLGRPRMSSTTLLDQRVGEFDVDDEVVSILPEKSSLPLIRDLSTDPATLCKLASGLSKFAATHPEVKGAWTIARVAVRLLVSKNGTLMKETSMKDIISLSVACASNKIPGDGRDTVPRLYAKRVVELLNDVLDVPTDNEVAITSLLKVSPHDIANLVWSLGELGIRHDKTGNKLSPGRKKLSFVTEKSLLSDHQIATLSTASLARFLNGLISMDFMSSDLFSLAQALRAFELRSLSDIQLSELCGLVESLARVKRPFLDSKTISVPEEPRQPSSTESLSDNPSKIYSNDGESVIASLSEEQILRKEISHLSRSILANAIAHAAQNVANLSPEQLRRFLVVVTMSPLEAHVFVESVERELLSRTIDKSQQSKSLESILAIVADTAKQSRSLLSVKSGQGDTPLTALKSGLRSLFFNTEQDNSESSEKWHQEVQEVTDLLNETMTHALYVADRLRAVTNVTGSGIDRILQSIEEGSNFELGRCKELIEAYHRIDFQTGTWHSRYDKERRKDIGKRLLSRRFL